MLWLRYLILALASIGAVTFYLWGRKTNQMAKALPVFLWLLNLAAFHAYRLAGVPSEVYMLNNWSLMIHLQAALSLAVVGVLLVRGR